MQKEILYKNEDAIKKYLSDQQNGLTKLNAFILQAEEKCKTQFKNDDKTELRNNAPAFLNNWIKSKYPFPEADDEFNQKAIGIDIKSLSNLFNRTSRTWLNYSYSITENGVFEIDDSNSELDRFIKYADTPKKVRGLFLAKKLSKLINEAAEEGFFDRRLLSKLSEMSDILDTERIKGTTNLKVVPNKLRISRMDDSAF